MMQINPLAVIIVARGGNIACPERQEIFLLHAQVMAAALEGIAFS
jgi:hypothetical protein